MICNIVLVSADCYTNSMQINSCVMSIASAFLVFHCCLCYMCDFLVKTGVVLLLFSPSLLCHTFFSSLFFSFVISSFPLTSTASSSLPSSPITPSASLPSPLTPTVSLPPIRHNNILNLGQTSFTTVRNFGIIYLRD